MPSPLDTGCFLFQVYTAASGAVVRGDGPPGTGRRCCPRRTAADVGPQPPRAVALHLALPFGPACRHPRQRRFRRRAGAHLALRRPAAGHAASTGYAMTATRHEPKVAVGVIHSWPTARRHPRGRAPGQASTAPSRPVQHGVVRRGPACRRRPTATNNRSTATRRWASFQCRHRVSLDTCVSSGRDHLRDASGRAVSGGVGKGSPMAGTRCSSGWRTIGTARLHRRWAGRHPLPCVAGSSRG